MARRHISTNRPDTLTQTFFTINFSLAVGRRTIDFGKFESPAPAFSEDDFEHSLVAVSRITTGLECIRTPHGVL
jgi:hypothetical protein